MSIVPESHVTIEDVGGGWCEICGQLWRGNVHFCRGREASEHSPMLDGDAQTLKMFDKVYICASCNRYCCGEHNCQEKVDTQVLKALERIATALEKMTATPAEGY